MGDKQNQPFQLSFNASLKVDFQGSRVTSDLPAAGRPACGRQTVAWSWCGSWMNVWDSANSSSNT